MAIKKPEQPQTVIQNCTFQAQASAANEHTEKAVVALSEAIIAQANANRAMAEAIETAARSLQGAEAHLGTGVYINQAKESQQ